ncbi:PIR Superfamily Protein [Plasmodium ovale wallikeri]|uniref:PIR Superfamily Protein n=1 Tax=Plasmodium ovale wallikeri TaxID=864142 RepID=A0A1A9AHI0_PLAOA|nr:PIR Superfamily Protein [Plasmodium ovale wallikeri]
MLYCILYNLIEYSFFKDFDYYEDNERNVVGVVAVKESCCKSFVSESFFTHIEFPLSFCEQFKKLYNLLFISLVNNKKEGSLDDNDCSFLNYWLNDKLRGNNIDNSISVIDFYKKLKGSNETTFKDEKLEKKLYNIEKHDLENMRKLYDLYNTKSKVSSTLTIGISTEESTSCLMHTNECYRKYRDAIINCHNGCYDFYNALTYFKNKYKNDLRLNSENTSSCRYEELFILPDYNAVLKEHESIQIIRKTTFSVLFPMFGVLLMLLFSDKLTPFRQYLFSKIKMIKNNLVTVGKSENELLLYSHDYDNIILDEADYNISYYTVRNS